MKTSRNNELKFETGLSLKDFLRSIAKAFIIGFGIVFGIIFLVLMIIGSFQGDLEYLMFSFFAIAGLFILSAPFAVFMFFLMAVLQYAILRNKTMNYQRIKGDDLLIFTQRAPLAPVLKNSIPIAKIEKVEPAPEIYFQQRKMKTPWYFRLNSFYRPPHGGLYNPMTNGNNLIVFYMSEPVVISNFEQNAMNYRMMISNAKPVLEVIIDVEKDQQERFMDELIVRKFKK